jgi:replicative DNA helicase
MVNADRQTQIAAWLAWFIQPGQVTELRALNVGGRRIDSDFFAGDQLDKMATRALELEARSATGIYFTPNPLRTDMATSNRAAGDKDIIARHWLLIDVDASREAKTSATGVERTAAWAVLDRCHATLSAAGFDGLVIGDSGNGWHLNVPVDLPNDDAARDAHKALLHGLKARCGDDLATVDTSTFNASRIWKGYGTFSRKGESTADRPHRQSRLVEGGPWARDAAQANNAALTRLLALWTKQDARRRGPDRPELTDREKAIHRARLCVLAMKDVTVCGTKSCHDKTFHVAAALAWGFGLSEDDALPILSEWAQRGTHAWTEYELRHKLVDGAKGTGAKEPKGHELGKNQPPPSTISQPPSKNGKAEAAASNTFKDDLIDAHTFALTDYRQDWIITKILAKGQPAIVGGPKKALKTCLMIDLAVSCATGTPFLGKFKVARPVRTAILSGESGEFTIKETAIRICRARGLELADIGDQLLFGFKLPKLVSVGDMAALQEILKRRQIELLIIDPLYLSLLAGQGKDGLRAENLYDMGPLLLGIAQACLSVGCTPVLVHHTRKGTTAATEPLDLDDLAYAGVAEFARQWILVSRRKRYDPDHGLHELWLSVGGSAGHGGLWSMSINEGLIDDFFAGRKWDVEVTTSGEARHTANDERDEEAAKKRTARNKGDQAQILSLLDATDPDRIGTSYWALQRKSELSRPRFANAVDELEEDGVVEQMTVQTPTGRQGRMTDAAGVRRPPIISSAS